MFRKFIAGLVVVTMLLHTHVLATPTVCHTTVDKTEGHKRFVIDYGATYHITMGGQQADMQCDLARTAKQHPLIFI